MSKPKIGIYGLTSCAGDQLTILNCEDELLEIASQVDIKSFCLAQTGNEETSIDIALVEGTVSTQRDLERLKEIRSRTAILTAMGTCASWGGMYAMRNDIPRAEMIKDVYGEKEVECFDALSASEVLPAQPLKNFVKVDLSIPGCPIEKKWFLRIFRAFLHGDIIELPNFSLCSECKMVENECLLVNRGMFCLGPITITGCKARCPSHNIPCIGCHGPVDETNYAAEVDILLNMGYTIEEIKRKMGFFVFNPDIKQRQ
ncbi:NADH:ubiquinone oxidoreductase [Candidatus Desantisbacteria bacterium]|nr:NADH:ubiquinone oxidoreductase [Candidatus Desantisbacteria bacterium]